MLPCWLVQHGNINGELRGCDAPKLPLGLVYHGLARQWWPILSSGKQCKEAQVIERSSEHPVSSKRPTKVGRGSAHSLTLKYFALLPSQQSSASQARQA